MTPNKTINNYLLNSPLIFPNKLTVYDHLFLTNGNGCKWSNGELIDHSLRENISLEDAIHDILMDDFSYELLQDNLKFQFTDDDDTALDSIINSFKRFNQRKLNLIQQVLSVDKLMEMSLCECNCEDLYPLCKYAKILNIPDDITKDWKECIEEFYNFMMSSNKHVIVEYREKYANEFNQIRQRLSEL